jgi:hypothetical protein
MITAVFWSGYGEDYLATYGLKMVSERAGEHLMVDLVDAVFTAEARLVR